MKQFTTLTLLLLINIGLQAQSIKYHAKQTEEFKQKGMVKKSFTYAFLGEDNHSFYYDFLPRFETYGYSQGYTTAHYICTVDKEMKTSTKQIVDFGKKENDNVKKIIYLNNNIYGIITTTEGLAIYKIDKTTCKPTSQKTILIPNNKSKYFYTNYSVKVSEDKNLLMIFYYITNEKHVPQKFAVHVFDMDFELLWKNNSIKPEFDGGYFSFDKLKISNNGEVYFLGSISSGEKVSYIRIGNYSNNLFRIDKAGKYYQFYHISDDEEIEHIDLAFSNDYMIRDVNYTINAEDITLYGIYCDEEMVSAKGVFTAKANFRSETMESIHTKSFSRELISKGYGEKGLKLFNSRYPDKEWDPFSYDLGDLKTRNDGSQYFVAEQWIRGRYRDNNVSMTCYLFKDLYIVSINDEFEIDRLHKISKTQYTPVYTDRCSYGGLEGDKGTYFIFNNFPELKPPMVKKGNTQIVLVSPSGQQKKSIIGSKFDDNTPVFLSTTFKESSPLEFVFERASIVPKKYAFVKMTIEE